MSNSRYRVTEEDLEDEMHDRLSHAEVRALLDAAAERILADPVKYPDGIVQTWEHPDGSFEDTCKYVDISMFARLYSTYDAKTRLTLFHRR